MNCFHHYAVVVFVIACNVVHGIQIKHKYDEYILSNDVISDVSESSKIELLKFDDLYNILRRKRGFFSSFKIPMPNMEFVHEDDDKNGVENTTVTSDADLSTTVKPGITATVNEAYNSFLDMMQSSKEIQIVAIGSDVKKSLVEAAPYLPLVNKLTKYIMPDLSMRDVVTLSLNVALLTTLGASDNANAQVNGDQSQSDIRNMVGQYATDIYGKLKDAFKSHIGQITNYFSNEEKTDSLAETHSIFDQMKKKMNSFMNSVDEPQTENKENQIETTLTQTYIENSQIPLTKTIVTKTYESDVEPIRRAINDKKYVIPKNKLLKNRNYKVNEIITEMKNELISEENWKNDSDMESYDYDNGDENMDDVDDDDGADDDDVDDADDDDDYDDDNITIDDNVELKEEDFNKVMQESMVLQADFVNTLDGKELLKHIEDLLKSLPNLNTNHKNRKTFKAVTEELGIDEQYSGDRVNKLINVLEVITNYFIVKAIEANVLLK